MADDVIPEDVKQFILQNIDSVAQFEGLLLLRTQPQAQWSRAEIARNLYISESEVAGIVAQLSAQGFLVTIETTASFLYQYHPKSPELELMIDRIAALYARHLVPITHLIHSKSKTRIQEFADAFRIRKD